MSKRLLIFIVSTFAITGIAWGITFGLAKIEIMSYGDPGLMVFFMLGGFGPTIGAYVSVISTRDRASIKEFHSRLFKYRVHPFWWAAAILLPFILNFLSVGIGVLISDKFRMSLEFQSWYMVFPLFLIMIIGGGLEELGWRGVALPEIVKHTSPLKAALFVSIIWAIWHVLLFYIPGTNQYGSSFLIFAVGAIGLGLLLAWLYLHTHSILLCVVFHASVNAAYSMGALVSSEFIGPALFDAGIKVFLGLILLIAYKPKRNILTN